MKCHAQDGVQVMQVNGAFVFSHFHLPYSRLTLKPAQMVLDLPWSHIMGPRTFRPVIRHQQSNRRVQIITLQLRRGFHPSLRPHQAPFRGRIPGHNRRHTQGSRANGMAAEKGASESCSTHEDELLTGRTPHRAKSSRKAAC